MNRQTAALMAVLMMCCPACSVFRPHTQQITVDATTNDVDVWLNGVYAGKTPVTQKVKRNRDLEILGKKEGYESYNKAVMSNMNATGKLDAIGLLFLLIPGVGLLTPGAYSLDDQVVIMDLRMAPQ